MPFSASDGRQWVVDRLAETTTPVIVDAGPGAGTYSVLGRHLRWDATWIGVEIHSPYIERFGLNYLYDRVIVADLREWTAPTEWTDSYSILLGDVLEHMTREDAVAVVEFHKKHATEMMVSVPIIPSPQDECFGNPHEKHLYDWTFAEMNTVMEGCPSFEGVQVGRWWRR